MIVFPLTRQNRIRLARAFATVPRVDISVECVLEDQMGAAYVDDLDGPTIFMIEQSGFFTYFAGDVSSAAGQALVRELSGGRLLMACTPGWPEAIRQQYGDRLIDITRYSFASDKLSLAHITPLFQNSPVRSQIRRLDADIVRSTSGPFVSISDFDSPEDFVQRGIGFACLVNDKVVGAAYSSLVSSRSIEVSVFVDEAHRRKGIATALGGALIEWCLNHHIEPHWDAANPESCGLAEKLGYISQGTYQAYYLK